MSRPRGFSDWRPQSQTRSLLADVKSVLVEYRDLLPLTVRQVFYRLVAKHGFEKTETAYNRLCEVLNRARRARLVDMSALRDDGFTLSEVESYSRESEVLDSFRDQASAVQLDRQLGQATRLVVWCEAQGMLPMLWRVTAPYGVPIASSGGFDSLTAKHDMAVRFAAADNVTVLHVGDYDPSGVHMFSALAEDIEAFTRRMGGEVEFCRVAVTAEQRDLHRLPTAPPKRTDRRSFADTHTVQCEALPPDVLLNIVEAEIRARRDLSVLQAVLAEEQELRSQLLGKLEDVA